MNRNQIQALRRLSLRAEFEHRFESMAVDVQTTAHLQSARHSIDCHRPQTE